MASRRKGVVDAAERLIREVGTTDFTMTALAHAAGVSPATPYNLFESKAALLYALLNRSMDGIDVVGQRACTEPDPFVRAMSAAEAVARFFTADANFYRVLYRFLLGVTDPVHRPAFMQRALDYWKQASQGLEQQGLFPVEIPHEQFAMQVMTSFIGATDMWVHEELGDDEFCARAAYGVLALALGVAQGDARKQVLSLMQQCRGRCSRGFSFDGARRTPATRPKLAVVAGAAARGFSR